MYTVLVVDDEELICLGIKSMIERIAHPQIAKVLIADHAATAEGIIRTQCPEIVITDIQMPGTNGLEMIKNMTLQSHGMKFIVLSGYDEFQYAREALKLGVIDYLLKPASIQELENVLDHAISALDMEKKSSSEEQERKYRQLFLENSLRKLFSYKNADDFDAVNIFNRLRQQFPYEDFAIGIISIKGIAGTRPAEPAGGGVESAGEGLAAAGDGWQVVGFANSNGRHVIVVNHSASKQSKELLMMLKDMAAEMADRWGAVPTAALSGRGKGIESLIALYKQAEKALSYRIIMDDARVIAYEGIKDRAVDTALVERKLGELHELLKLRKEEQLSSFVDSLFCMGSLANQSIDCISRLYLGINRQLGGLAVSGLQLSMEESVKPIESFDTLQEIRIYLKEKMRQVIIALKEEDAGKKVMVSVMNYIRQNMGEKISLEDAANRAGISYTHYSRLFKKLTGMNFSEYLMMVRMEEAKRLLDDSVLKVYEIAAKVGYSDPKHFCRAFRLYYNVSPIEYRLEEVRQSLPQGH